MRFIISFLAFLTVNIIVAQVGYQITYEKRSVNNTYTRLSEQLSGNDRTRMASKDYVIRTFQLTHVNGVSRYKHVSSRYDTTYAGQQYPTGTSTIHYKNLRSKNEPEILVVSSMRGCERSTELRVERYIITDSIKMIDDILVQKAEHRDLPNVHVWFAPSISIADGPASIAGFPGLVIDYVGSSHRTIVTNIKQINSNSMPSIVRPNCPLGEGGE